MLAPSVIGATMTFWQFDLETALKSIKQAGFDAAEMTVARSFFLPEELNAGKIREIRDMVEAIGIEIPAINCGTRYPTDPAGQKKVAAAYRNLLELAKALGTKLLTMGAGEIGADRGYISGLNEISAYCSGLAKTAREEYGVVLAAEAPHKKSITESPAQYYAYWKAAGSDLKITMDVAHITYAGGSIFEFIEEFGDRIAHVHLRDAVAGNSLLSYGEGEVDFRGIIAQLKKIGYSGLFSLEFPGTDSQEESMRKLLYAKEFIEKCF